MPWDVVCGGQRLLFNYVRDVPVASYETTHTHTHVYVRVYKYVCMHVYMMWAG
jgi:hypothetical protein